MFPGSVPQIALEFCSKGSVGDQLRDHKAPIRGKYAAAIMLQLLVALKQLHDRSVVHRDIKADNLLLMESGEVKLADMGLGRVLANGENKRHTAVLSGSPYWLPPDFLTSQVYSVKTDVWAVGVVLIELLEVFPPLHQFLPMVAMFHLARGTPEHRAWFREENKHPPMAVDFARACLALDPDARPSVEELLRHPFVAQVGDLEAARVLVRAVLEGDASESDEFSSVAVDADFELGDSMASSGNSVSHESGGKSDSASSLLEELDCDETDSFSEKSASGFLRRLKSGTLTGRMLGGSSPSASSLSQRLRSFQEADLPQIQTVRDLVRALFNSTSGVPVKDRMYHGRVYPRCFIASEAVSWMLARLNLSDRREAVSLGVLLQRRGVIHHVAYGHQFCDAKLFFRFALHERRKTEALTESERDLHKFVTSKLDTPSEYQDLVTKMREAVTVKDRSYHGRTFKKCFLGSDAVDWFSGKGFRDALKLPEEIPRVTRAQAVDLGQMIMARGAFHHVVDREVFQDKKFFFRFFSDE